MKQGYYSVVSEPEEVFIYEFNRVTNYLCSTYQILKTQSDLSPNNNIINEKLEELVCLLMDWVQQAIISIEDIDAIAPHLLVDLPNTCAAAECEMEKWWARQIISRQSGMEDFWYLDNYRFLTQAEFELLPNHPAKTIIFLGSGALPVTAFYAATNGYHVTCVDRDAEACTLAADVTATMGMSHKITIIESDAETYSFSKDNLVICASLLETKALYHKLYQDKVDQLIVRDSENLFRLLYQSSTLPDRTKYTEIRRTDLNSKCINISRYFERVT